MRLTDLEPKFVRHETRDGVRYHIPVDTLDEAQSVLFLCPTCFLKNHGAVGTHAILVTFAGRGVAEEDGSHNREGKPSRWEVAGSGYHDLTLRPSIDISTAGDGEWHGYITNGEIS